MTKEGYICIKKSWILALVVLVLGLYLIVFNLISVIVAYPEVNALIVISHMLYWGLSLIGLIVLSIGIWLN